MRRTFTAAIRLYTIAGARAAAAECLLYIDVEPFSRTRWGGTLSKIVAEQPMHDGPYLLRLPGGRTARIKLTLEPGATATFTGEGDLAI
ncbi:MAG TPA: hypothetical protein VKV26_21725 [Dehalococcoidia bacterium]|nr:hypothetical protein [Dehalococcoidia bacterium]